MGRGFRRCCFVACVLSCVSCGDDEPVGDGSFGSTCEGDADCDVGTCFEFGSKGKRCTESCPADPADCPNDGLGCNDKGVCKLE